jgi:hypothetical protein
MPFLFVDYDQGAGGEKFCAGLSQSLQCEDIESICYPNGRTKVHDIFGQEFLKSTPNINPINSHHNLYTIVPTHRHTELATQLLKNVCSVRIQMPVDEHLRNHIVTQRINKVLLTHEPTPEYFFGLLKNTVADVGNTDFIKKVNIKMTTIEILMISRGIEVNPANIELWLDKIRNNYGRQPEPNFNYDMVIPYENLVYNPNQVGAQLKSKFGIDVVGNWLSSYAIT